MNVKELLTNSAKAYRESAKSNQLRIEDYLGRIEDLKKSVESENATADEFDRLLIAQYGDDV